VGTLLVPFCGYDAIAHWSTPNSAAVGFDCWSHVDDSVIRPTDGKLLFLQSDPDRILEFACDICPYTNAMMNYPPDPVANDVFVQSCSDGAYIQALLASPDGTVLHRCSSSYTVWRDNNDVPVYSLNEELLHLGYASSALTKGHVVDLSTAASVPLTNIPIHQALTARALPGGGFVVVIHEVIQPDDYGAQQLWHVAADGAGTLLGSYPTLPSTISHVIPSTSRLEACGALVQIGTVAPLHDVIVRRELNGASAVVYDEATQPLVQLHGSTLVTGP
jgi:hypothetical protein